MDVAVLSASLPAPQELPPPLLLGQGDAGDSWELCSRVLAVLLSRGKSDASTQGT